MAAKPTATTAPAVRRSRGRRSCRTHRGWGIMGRRSRPELGRLPLLQNLLLPLLEFMEPRLLHPHLLLLAQLLVPLLKYLLLLPLLL